jgi:hypothetical protein
MTTKVNRMTVDLSQYVNLVVIYLGMRVNRLTGLKTLIGFGPQIAKSAADRPEGLLSHENMVYSLFPMHVIIRQYWRDMESLLQWSRSEPHRVWWKSFLRDSGGAGFWHETYLMQGGHGSDLRRCSGCHRVHAIRTGTGRAGDDVWRRSPGR